MEGECENGAHINITYEEEKRNSFPVVDISPVDQGDH